MWLRRLDWLSRLRVVDVRANWEQLESLYPGVRRDACLDEMHVVTTDGVVTAGFDGCRTIAWHLPLLMPLAPLLYAPGVPSVGRAIYCYVATHRSTTCDVASRHRSG